jgi:hypothetical protein
VATALSYLFFVALALFPAPIFLCLTAMISVLCGGKAAFDQTSLLVGRPTWLT